MDQHEELLEGYSQQEKAAYINAIASIATADRQASQDELDYITALCQAANLGLNQVQMITRSAMTPSINGIGDSLNVLKNSQLRFSLMADMISFAKSDGSYTADEEARIKDVARDLNIDSAQFSALNKFVSEASNVKGSNQDVLSSNFLNSSGLGGILSQAGISQDALMKGMLGVVAPIILAKVMGGNKGNNAGNSGNMGMGGLLGTVLNSGVLNQVGGANNRQDRGAVNQSHGGGLGSIISVLGKSTGKGQSGGLGSILGKVLGGM